jgi:hypothetical protein
MTVFLGSWIVCITGIPDGEPGSPQSSGFSICAELLPCYCKLIRHAASQLKRRPCLHQPPPFPFPYSPPSSAPSSPLSLSKFFFPLTKWEHRRGGNRASRQWWLVDAGAYPRRPMGTGCRVRLLDASFCGRARDVLLNWRPSARSHCYKMKMSR